MARSVIQTPRTRQPQRIHRIQRIRETIEQRPVLQLPIEGPRWGDPPASTPEADEPSSERGVAVIDFFI